MFYFKDGEFMGILVAHRDEARGGVPVTSILCSQGSSSKGSPTVKTDSLLTDPRATTVLLWEGTRISLLPFQQLTQGLKEPFTDPSST